MIKHTTKKVIAWILIIVMAINLIPNTAIAEGLGESTTAKVEETTQEETTTQTKREEATTQEETATILPEEVPDEKQTQKKDTEPSTEQQTTESADSTEQQTTTESADQTEKYLISHDTFGIYIVNEYPDDLEKGTFEYAITYTDKNDEEHDYQGAYEIYDELDRFVTEDTLKEDQVIRLNQKASGYTIVLTEPVKGRTYKVAQTPAKGFAPETKTEQLVKAGTSEKDNTITYTSREAADTLTLKVNWQEDNAEQRIRQEDYEKDNLFLKYKTKDADWTIIQSETDLVGLGIEELPQATAVYKDGTWSYNYAHLPKYDTFDEKVTYGISQLPVDNYDLKEDSDKEVTNTLKASATTETTTKSETAKDKAEATTTEKATETTTETKAVTTTTESKKTDDGTTAATTEAAQTATTAASLPTTTVGRKTKNLLAAPGAWLSMTTSLLAEVPDNEKKIIVSYSGSPTGDFVYEIKNGEANYTGGYRIYDKDGKLIATYNSLGADANGCITIKNGLSAPANAEPNEAYQLEENKNGYTIVLTDNITDVTQKNNAGLALESKITQQLTADNKSVSFTYRESADDVVLKKTWNDGRENHEALKDHYLEKHVIVKYSVDNGENWDTDFSKIGINYVPTPEASYEGSEWSYTYKNLPKNDHNGDAITYGFEEVLRDCGESGCSLKGIASSYIATSPDGKPNEIINTQKVNLGETKEYSATIVWKDRETGESIPETRPNTNVFVENIKLYRTVNGGNKQEVTFTTEQVVVTSGTDADKDKWNITLADLPKYDDQGNEYTYYIEQTSDFATGTGVDDPYKYDKEYVNTGSFGTETKGLYNGGTLTDTRKETMKFLFDVEWIDGNSTWLEDCDLYLYRYAEGDGGSVAAASPVQGFDTMFFENGTLYYVNSSGTKVEVQKEDGQYVWTGTDGTTGLDKFAPSGARYTYFIKQKNLGSADYKDSYYDSGSTTERTDKYILNNGKIVNQLENTVTPSITKKWEAKAVQGITNKLSVVLGLQKRYVYQTSEDGKNTQYTEWEDVTQVPKGEENAQPVSTSVGGFSSAVLEKEVGFDGYPEYTDKKIENAVLENSGGTVELKAGTKIEYRCKETGITYQQDTDTTKEYTFVGNQLVMKGLGAEGTDIVVEQEYSKDGKTITNKLVDRTQVKVTKTWSGLAEGQWPKGAVVNVRLKREDGDPVIDLDKNNVSSITLSEGKMEGIFENLPRYDDNGREITYYVEEKETTVIADGKEYSYYDTSYSRTTVASNDVNIRETDATIHNTLPGPGDITINVNKRWLDDGDMTHREAVQVGIFSRSDITSGDAFSGNTLNPDKAVKKTEITDNDAWTKKLSFEPNRKTYYWTFNGDFNDATQTEANSKPVYNSDGQHVERDGSPLYWKDDAVTETEVATDYPVYIQKTTTEYTTSDGTVQATNYDGSLLYWEDTAKTKTTTDATGHEPVMLQVKSDGQPKDVYLDANGKETTEATNTPVYIKKQENTDHSDRYIALEIKVGDSSVTYKKNDSYAWLLEKETQIPSYDTFKDEKEAAYQIGDVEATNHLYNVYLGYTNANGMAGYVIYNQRKGVQKITLTKTWKNGNLPAEDQPKAAYYKLYQWLDNTSTDVTESLGGGEQTLAAYGTIAQADADRADRIGIVVEVKNGLSKDNPTENEIKAVFQNLPKYDHLGRLLHYTAEEVAVKDPMLNTTTTGEGDAAVTTSTYPIRLVDNGVVKVSVKQDGKFKYDLGTEGSNVAYYDTYETSMTETQTTAGGKNTNDEFEFKSTNTRKQDFAVTLRKVWQDDGTNQNDVNVRRPDIYFNMYKIAIKGDNSPKKEADLLEVEDVDTLISKSEPVGGDYIWNTKKNNWYWSCETDGTFDRYDSDGNEYLYYAVEKSLDFNEYQVKYYNGEVLPNEKKQDDTAMGDTTQVFNPNLTAQNEVGYKGNLLVVHKEGDGLQSNGTIVNVKKDKFTATAEKKWLKLPDNMDRGQLPDIYMELRRRLVLDERSQNYGPWETVSVKKNQGGAATSVFENVEKYDEYGRRYEFAVQEKYYEPYTNVALGTKLALGADSRFIIFNHENGLDSIIKNEVSSVTIGEGYYVKNGDGPYREPITDGSVTSDTKFYTRKVTYTQENTGSYVRIAQNEFVALSSLSDTEQGKVKDCNRYSREDGDYQELGANTILALNHVPGYRAGTQQGDNKFTWTNEYDPNAQLRQRVQIKVNKTWSVPAYAKELPVQKFELWRRIEDVAESDELVSTDSKEKKDISEETVTDYSKTVNTEITFTTINDNSNNNKYLAYFAPNGKPYTYYVKEIVPSGYLGSVAGAAGSNPNTQQGDGNTELQTQDIKLNYYTASDGTIVFYNYDTTKTDDEAKDTTTSYTNTYNGLPVVTNKAVKNWVDQSNVFGMRPTDINLTLKQTGGGITDTDGRIVAEWIQGTDTTQNGTWSKPENSNQWTLDFTNAQIKDEKYLKEINSIKDNAYNFPKYGPNGEDFTYKVSESKSASDTTNMFGSYDQKIVTTKDDSGNTTNTITNTLPTTSISAKKVWKGTDGQTLDTSKLEGKSDEEKNKEIEAFNNEHTWIYDGTNTAHNDEELKTLCNLGAMPTKITFKLQYRDSDTADWKDVTDNNSPKKYTQVYNLARVGTDGNLIIDGNGKLSWDENVIKNMRSNGYTFEDLPKYILGDNTSKSGTTLRQYRVLETPEYTKVTKTENTQATGSTDTPTYTYTVSHPELTALNAGQFQQEGTATTATADGTSVVTNQLTLKKITLDKYWNDNKNYMNTRPTSVDIDVSNANGEEIYTLNKSSSQSNDNENWYKEVWIPNIDMTVSETISETVNSAMKDLYTATVTVDAGDANKVKVTNTYNVITKRTSITVSKEWNDGTDKDYSAFYSAIRPNELEVSYKLQYSYRKKDTTDKWWDGTTENKWKDADAGCGIGVGDNARVGNTLTTKYNATNKGCQDVTWTNLFQYFKDDSTDQALPIRYRVVESSIPGYTTSYSTDNGNEIVAIEATKDGTYNTKGSIAVTNTVDNTTKVTLKKQWDDLETTTKAIETALSGTQTGKIGTNTTVEALDSLDDIKALQDKGILPYAIKFQLQFTTADNPIVSDWEDASDKVYEADTPEKLLAVLNGTDIYTDLPKTGTNGKQIKYRFVESAIKFTSTGNYINVVSAATKTNDNNLTDSTTLYTVDTERSSSTDETSKNVTDVTTITNKIPTGTIEVSKSAIDEGNRDNMRGDIKVTLQRKVGENYYTDYATGILTYDDATGTWTSISFSVPIYDTSTFTDKTTGASKWRVVENEVGTHDEGYKGSLLNDYSPNVKLTSGSKSGTMAIENTRVPARFKVSAQKSWNDDNNSMNTRPTNSEVNFTLQYSTDKGTSWHDIKESTSGAAAPGTGTDTSKPYYQTYDANVAYSGYYYIYKDGEWTANGNGTDAFTTKDATQVVNGLTGDSQKKATWENVPVYTVDTADNDGIIYYRVVENKASDGADSSAVTGYKVVTVADISITGATLVAIEGQKGVFTASKDAQADVTITNNVDTVSLDLTKTWTDDLTNNYTKAMRPDKVKYKIEYTLKGLTDWKKLPSGITSSVTVDENGCFTLNSTKTSATDTKTIAGLPLKNNSGVQYLYRISEVSVYYGTTEVGANLVTSSNNVTWAMANDFDSNFAETADNSGNTVGAYTITNGQTVWDATNKKWVTSIENKLETVSLEATKDWVDDNNRDNTQIDLTFDVSMKVNNTANTDFTVASQNLLLTAKDSSDNRVTTVTWTNLPKYSKTAANHADTTQYQYFVTEKAKDSANNLTKYDVQNHSNPAFDSTTGKWSTTITNIHDIDTFKIKGEKYWNDAVADNEVWVNKTVTKDNRRATNITLTLQYLNTSNVWTDVKEATFVEADQLPTTATGTKDNNAIYFKYNGTATEDKVRNSSGYYIWQNGAYVPDNTGVYTTKDVNQKATSTTGDTWTGYEWTDLPVYYNNGTLNGQQISYRVYEATTNWSTCYFAQPSDTIAGTDNAELTGTVTNKLNKLKLVKTTNGTDRIKGVKFKLVNKTNANETYEVETDDNGEIIFTGLAQGTYVITELNTISGHQLLSAPFEVTIPQKLSKANADKETNIDYTNAVLNNEQTEWSFYQLTYTVTNSANFTMPMTGGKTPWYPIIIVILGVGICLVGYRKRKKVPNITNA